MTDVKDVSPAGGEVEIAGYAGRNALTGFMNNGTEVSVMVNPARFYDVPLTPLENVTRLQAERDMINNDFINACNLASEIETERDALKAEVERLNRLNDELNGKLQDAHGERIAASVAKAEMQSELTKARELILEGQKHLVKLADTVLQCSQGDGLLAAEERCAIAYAALKFNQQINAHQSAPVAKE